MGQTFQGIVQRLTPLPLLHSNQLITKPLPLNQGSGWVGKIYFNNGIKKNMNILPAARAYVYRLPITRHLHFAALHFDTIPIGLLHC